MKIIITESQYKKVIKSTIDEAVAYSVAKKYLEIERSPEAEERIKQVFNNLKSLPNARQLDRRGWRISFPYTNDSTENEIKDILEPYQFTIKDYRNNLAIDVKNNREIALNKALNIVSKKEPDVKELMDRYASIKSRGVIDKENDLMIVFSSAKYDILGMTTGRDWADNSCMDLISGNQRSYVKTDLKEGTIICYLTRVNDTNLENPLGRVLIKPFINLKNDKDVILYAELKTYGNIPNSENFTDNIDGYMEKTQKLSGSYKKLGCLYHDGGRTQIEDKETIRTRSLKKIKDDEPLTDTEFVSLPLIVKRKLLDRFITEGKRLDEIYFKFTSQSQKKRYVRQMINKGNEFSYIEFKIFPKELKIEVLNLKLNNNKELQDWEFFNSTNEQKEKHSHIKIKNEKNLERYEFNSLSQEKKEEYLELKLHKLETTIELLKNKIPLEKIKLIVQSQGYYLDIEGHELKHLNPVQKKRYMEIISKFN
jgi:hypothetical protein